MGIEAKSKNPNAAWLFLQWIAWREQSIERLLWGVANGPARKSQFYHPQAKEKIGTPSDTFLRLVARSLDIAEPNYRPLIPEYGEIGTTLATLISGGVGTKGVQEALDTANEKIYKIMEAAGYYD